MFEISISAQFEAAHRLVGDFGPATRLHGHTYKIEVMVRGRKLREDGSLYDLGALGTAVEDLAATLHYRDLDAIPELEGINTTAEAMASYCWDRLAPPLRGRGLHSLAVRIWESPQAYASRDDALNGG
jgi:6-pyruvoyltetrahydropterin/6-carboxytetrahydropterin synthase